MGYLLFRIRGGLWRRYRRGLPLLSFALFAGSASATTITFSQFPPNPNVMPGGGWQFKSGSTFADPPPPRAWVNGVYGGVPKTVATDIVTVAGRAGNLPITVTSTIGLGDAAAAAARCLALANPLCATAATAYAAYRVYKDYSGNGGLVADPGTNPVTQTVTGYKVTASNGAVPSRPFSPTYQEACDARAADMKVSNGASWNYRGVWNGNSTDNPRCLIYEKYLSNPEQLSYSGGYAYNTSQQNTCPASIDFSNPAYNVPAGSPVGIDGKCPTARYNHSPITDTQARDKVLAFPPTFPNSTWRDAVGDAVDKGGQTVPSDISTTGPASQTGTPKQTVKTEGTTTTTTTETPTYNYTYNGDTVIYNTTNVTNTTINNNGTVTTTTTTTTGGAATPQDPTDPCTANPDRIGCKSAGTVAPQPDLYTKKTKTFDDVLADFKAQINASPLGTATGGFFNVSGGGTCPTWSVHLPFLDVDLTIDQFCSDFATSALAFMRTALLVVASLVAFRVAVL